LNIYKANFRSRTGKWLSVDIHSKEPVTVPTLWVGSPIFGKVGEYGLKTVMAGLQQIDFNPKDAKVMSLLGKNIGLTPAKTVKFIEDHGWETLCRPLNPKTLEALKSVPVDKTRKKYGQDVECFKSLLEIYAGIPKVSWSGGHPFKEEIFNEDPYLFLAYGGTLHGIDKTLDRLGLERKNRIARIHSWIAEDLEQSGFFGHQKATVRAKIKALCGQEEVEGKKYWIQNQKNGLYYHCDTVQAIALVRLCLFEREKDSLQRYDAFSLFSSHKLSKHQVSAIHKSLRNRVSYVSGSAGTGKTSVLGELLLHLRDYKKDFVVLAPTGKAVSRIAQISGISGYTMHKFVLLENQKPDYIIIDESSMISIKILARILKENPNASYIFFGDEKQLPSISGGKFFFDLLNSGVEGTRLTEIFRQTDLALIEPALSVVAARPYREKHLVRPYSIEEIDAFIDRDFQIITPYNVGEMGTTVINQRTQKLRFSKTTPSITIFNQKFYLGDRVIQTKNKKGENSLSDTNNGEIGVIIEVQRNGVIIQFHNRKILISKYDLATFSLAYAITVHKSQGSEWDKVLFLFPKGSPSFLTRELAYTALTRGKKETLVMGDTTRLFSGELKSHQAESILKNIQRCY
jgi:hypothetical protein